MKKKSKKMIMLVSALLILMTIGIGGYTYAKYKTSVNGTGQVDVAKWSFKVNDNSQQMETIQLTDTIDETKLINGKVAPGTSGKITLNINGSGSEVGLTYEVGFENEQNKPTNLVFTYGGEEYKSLSKLSKKITGDIFANDANKVRTVEIPWVWEYETGSDDNQISANDVIDTTDGINNLDYTFDVVVTGTQMLTK